ncbi:MAG: hypothetical protein ACRECR_04105, partial [Thermoplasmata archaeon]
VQVIRDPVAQVRALLEIEYGHGAEFGIEAGDSVVSLTVPERSKFDFHWMAAKPRLIERIRAQLKPATLRIVEEYLAPASKAAGSPKNSPPPTPTSDPGPAEAVPAASAGATGGTVEGGPPSKPHAHERRTRHGPESPPAEL